MDIITDFEQQYATLTAEITSEIGKLKISQAADRNKLITSIDRQIEESHELLEQLGLEIREISNGSQRATVQSRLNCYQAELKRLQVEFSNAKSRSPGYESVDEFEEIGIQEDQKRRLLDNSEKLERVGNRLNDGYRVCLETEQIGSQILNDLSDQRETIQRSRARLRETDAELGRSSRLLNSMIFRAMREKIILISVAVALVLVVVLSIYFSISN